MTHHRPFTARNVGLLGVVVGVAALLGADVAGLPLSARLPIALVLLVIGAFFALHHRLPAHLQLGRRRVAVRASHAANAPRTMRSARPHRRSRPSYSSSI